MKKPQKSKSFKYNLETVLKVREIRQKQQEERLSKAQQHLTVEQKKEMEIKNFQSEKFIELRGILDTGKTITDFSEIMRRKSHLDVVKEQVVAQEKKRVEAEEQRNDERKKLVAANQKKQVMETDKDKKKVAWRRVMAREDIKRLDDMTQSRFARKPKDL
jgi:flagellar export protein FliJ